MHVYAPIALFVYNRPWHTRRTVEALSRNDLAKESDLIVFSDGARSEAEREIVETVRRFIRSIRDFRTLHLVESRENRGLAKSITTGVGNVLDRYDRIIVVEDDLVTSPFFLRYMNDALALYEKEDSVVSVHGYCPPLAEELPSYFFLRGADCWGWGTWRRGWKVYEADGRRLLAELRRRKLTRAFDLDGTYPFTRMLVDQIAGHNDSWAIRWYASAFLAGKLTLHPGSSHVRNIGLDGSGQHCGVENMAGEIASSYSRPPLMPPCESLPARRAFAAYHRRRGRNSLARRALGAFSRFIHAVFDSPSSSLSGRSF